MNDLIHGDPLGACSSLCCVGSFFLLTSYHPTDFDRRDSRFVPPPLPGLAPVATRLVSTVEETMQAVRLAHSRSHNWKESKRQS